MNIFGFDKKEESKASVYAETSKERVLLIGVISSMDWTRRTLAIARGESVDNNKDVKNWYASFDTVARLLSDHNRRVMNIITAEQPESIVALSILIDRSASGTKDLLHKLESHGLVTLVKNGAGRLKPLTNYDRFEIVIY